MQENIRLRQRSNRYEVEESREDREYSSDSVPPKCLTRVNQFPTLGGLAVICSLAYLAFYLGTYLNYRYPKPLNVEDVAKQSNQFIAERAYADLFKLVKLGPRVAGSQINNVVATRILTNELEAIKAQANSFNNMTIDVSHSSEEGYIQFGSNGMVTKFNDLVNIAVKFGPHDDRKKLLVNCHFDSVYTSPGASDDGLNCAVMLEVLRVLSKRTVSMKRDIIFLFNGAEETSMQGSYAFMKTHSWAEDIFAFLNYDSCGAGGKEILFQASTEHPWMVEIYSKFAKHPFASVVGEELFNYGVIPSYTDYQNFRDLGKLPGLDFAHFTNGYVYHTKYDDINLIDRGVYQNTGDNMLALVKAFTDVTDESFVAEKFDGKKLVYYDFCGLVVFYYSQTTNTILNLAIILLIFYNVLQNTFVITEGLKRVEMMKQLALGFAMPLIGIIMALTSVTIIAFEMKYLSRTMSWFTHGFLLLPLYGLPVVICLVLPMLSLTSYKYSSLCWGKQVQMYMNGILLIINLLFLLGTMAGLRMTFLFFVSLITPSIASSALGFFNRQRSVSTWLLVYMLSFIPHIVNTINMSARILNLFIPLMGRFGPSQNPDLFVGMLFSLVFIYIIIFLIPAFLMIAKPFTLLGALLVIHIVSLTAIIFTPIGFPYGNDPLAPTPQRFSVIHTDRVFYELNSLNESQRGDSGFWIVNFDHNRVWTLEDHVLEVRNGSMKRVCGGDAEFLCGLPFLTVGSVHLRGTSNWISADPPKLLGEGTELTSATKTQINKDTVRFTFEVFAPDRASLILSPSKGYQVSAWSFKTGGPKQAFVIDGRSVYFIYYQHGDKWQFWIDVQNIDANHSEPSLDIAVNGHYQDGSHNLADNFKQFLAQFPSWAEVTAWPASYKAYKFSF